MTKQKTAIQALLDADIYTDAPERQDQIAAIKAAVENAMRTPNNDHMVAFIRSMASLTTPEDEFADPDLGNKEMYDDIEEMVADISNDRLYDEYTAFMAMVRDARKILAGDATTDSGHAKPQGQPNVA